METLAQAIMVAGKAIGAGLCMGIGAIGPGVGEVTPSARRLKVWRVIRRWRVRCVLR